MGTNAMNDLIERLEKATGPDRELDLAIGEAVGEANHSGPAHHRPFREWAKHYTASIDAALTLVPEGWWMTLDRYVISDEPEPSPMAWRAWLRKIEGDLDGDGPVYHRKHFSPAPTPAIALCIAAMKARQSHP